MAGALPAPKPGVCRCGKQKGGSHTLATCRLTGLIKGRGGK
jgi:hypothetical protein